jgi:hypothetical protein
LHAKATAMITLEALLGKGYFPSELPPPFNTVGYATFLKDGGFFSGGLPKQLRSSRASIYNLAQAGGVRRRLSILNPIHYYRLSEFVAQHWVELHELAIKSPISLTKPVTTNPRRAIERELSLSDRPVRRAKARRAARYLFKSDIARFYQTVYTHSIPWAIHGKAVAKADHSSALYGNVLDSLIQSTQHGQTIGIPVGPDVSLLIAEIILAAVDQDFLSRVKAVGIRFMDDYELSFGTLADAESASGALQEALAQYELSLNETKTDILELPVEIQESWATELSTFGIRRGTRAQQADLLSYFDKAFELARSRPSVGILRYVTGRAAKLNVHEENENLLKDLLLQCALAEPGCLPTVLQIFGKLKARTEAGSEAGRMLGMIGPLSNFSIKKGIGREKFDARAIEPVLNSIIQIHAPQGHTSEVAWSIWGCIVFNLRVRAASLKRAIAMQDPTVSLLTLHARETGLLTKGTTLAEFQQFMTADHLYDEQWLLSYEANVKGWLPSVGPDHVHADPLFSLLKKNGVSFYDVNKAIIELEDYEFEEEEDEAPASQYGAFL